MSPLFLVNWHRVAGQFRTLMWLVALALVALIVVNSVPAPQAAPAQTPRSAVVQGVAPAPMATHQASRATRR
jgi:hypothetical protein